MAKLGKTDFGHQVQAYTLNRRLGDPKNTNGRRRKRCSESARSRPSVPTQQAFLERPIHRFGAEKYF